VCNKTVYGKGELKGQSTVANFLQRSYENVFGINQSQPFTVDRRDVIPKYLWGAGYSWWSGTDHYKVNFFESLPAETWEAIRNSETTGWNELLKQQKATPCGVDPRLVLASVANLAVSNNYAATVGPNQNCGGVQDIFFIGIPQQADTGSIAGILKQISSAAYNVGQRVIDNASKLAQVALISLLKFFGIDPVDFFKQIDALGNYLGNLASNGRQIIGNFIDGGTKGFKDFVTHIKVHFKKGLLDWLRLPPKLLDVGFEDFSLAGFTNILLELVGYTWDNLIGLVREAVGPQNYAVIGEAYDIIADVVDKGLFPWIEGQVKKIEGKLEGLGELWQDMLKSAGIEVGKIAGTAIAEKLLTIIFPVGAIGQFLLTLYRAVKWFLDETNRKQVVKVFDIAKEGFKDVVNKASPDKVADKVQMLLASVIAPALSGLATLFGLGDIPKAIRTALEKLKESALKPVKAFLNAIVKKFRDLILDPLLSKLGLKAKPPLTKPMPFNNGQDELWLDVDGGQVHVMMASGKKKRVKEQLDEWAKCATSSQEIRLLKKACPITAKLEEKSGKELAQKLQADLKGGTATSKGPVVKDTSKTQAEVKADKQELSGVLNELLNLKRENPCCKKEGSCSMLPAKGSCFAAGTWWLTATGPRQCQDVRLGQLVAELTPAERAGRTTPAQAPIDPATWQLVRLVMDGETKGRVTIERLYPLDWLHFHGASIGARLWLDLEHVGVRGWAQVTAVEPCPELERGPGRRVLARFEYDKGLVYNLQIEGETEPIGVTPTHPFWSVDRQGWVPAGELRVGERLVAQNGTTPRVVAWTVRAEPERVYNIEVDGDHVYRVGHQGLLVHNASAPCNKDTLPGYDCLAQCPLFGSDFKPNSDGKEFMDRDSLGRAQGVRARLCSANAAVGGSPPANSFCPKGYVKGFGGFLIKAHLLPEKLGGPGSDTPDGRRNLVTVCASTNAQLSAGIEQDVIKLVFKPNKFGIVSDFIASNVNLLVDYEVRLTYSGKDPMPQTIKVTARAVDLEKSNSGKVECKTLYLDLTNLVTDPYKCNGAPPKPSSPVPCP
jgi:hypothetical protein